MTAAVAGWRWRAACLGVPTKVFFPPFDKGESVTRSRSYMPALAWCARCPVQTQCLNDALARGDVEHGVIGGMTPLQRRRERELRGGRPTVRLCCWWCARIFLATRSTARYCSSRCQQRQRAHRARQRRAS